MAVDSAGLEYHQNGSLMREQPTDSQGRIHGEVNLWDDRGKLCAQFRYHQGVLQQSTQHWNMVQLGVNGQFRLSGARVSRGEFIAYLEWKLAEVEYALEMARQEERDVG